MKTCKKCNGLGYVYEAQQAESFIPADVIEKNCPNCGGEGYIPENPYYKPENEKR